MLAHLHIRNLAVIDEIELELGQGLTVLTGETGAGKSILVDALALALGERADSQAIRTGTDRCEITATFDLSQRANVKTWLSENDLDENSDCILRRVVTTEGRSRGYVNGRTVPMQTLRELGEQLVDICGQQTHHSLRHAQVQRDILDQVGKHDKLRESMGKSHHAWQQTRTKFDALSAALEDRLARQDLLSYQVSELEALNVHNGEYQELEQEHRLVANSSRIADGISAAVQLLYESAEPD